MLEKYLNSRFIFGNHINFIKMDDQQKEQQTKGIKRKTEKDQDTIPMKKLMVQTDTIFKNWVNEWRINSLKYTSVDLSMHCSADNIPPNFLMLSQGAMKRRSRSKIIKTL